MAAPERHVAPDGGAAPLLEATGVSFSYGRVPVLERVDLRVVPGEFVALVGPNGSGKSTLIKLLLGSLTPSEGEVRLFGAPPRLVKDRWRLGYVPQRPVNELSGGQQQRAFIARAFASGPELLVLDEPIAGIDAESQRRFRDSLVHLMRDHGAGVLLVSHELSAVANDLDRVVVLKGTVLFDGPPSRLTDEGVSLGVHREDLPLWLEGLR